MVWARRAPASSWPASGHRSYHSRARSSAPGWGPPGRRGRRCGTACRTTRCGGPSRRSGRGQPEPPACSGCLMSPCACCTAIHGLPGMPGTRLASRRGDDESRRERRTSRPGGPLLEVTGARGEGQADRCRVRPRLVCSLPPARVLSPAWFQVCSRPRLAPPGPGSPVPPGYSIALAALHCCRQVDVVMAGWPGAAHDRLPADMPHGRPGVPRRPLAAGARRMGWVHSTRRPGSGPLARRWRRGGCRPGWWQPGSDA